ncbi:MULTISPECIES: IS21 family transposase [unclassified Mycobacterium]|uniref:IS21 family transposase n=1 Tax=unclassified Mycobacterium TaxID=2642494 RepID=UPI0007FF239E|nr:MULTISPECIES: IS21 family transposase [unclassified Mycobacterium]OBB38704.1 transposase [Mycobacterium sp. 852002-51961_SCH5331710]OBG91817.1 transposase [Mycobacterium sp. E136]
MLAVEDWAEIRRLHRAEGLPIKLIARTLGISRNTVRSALASEAPPKYERRPAGSAVDAFEDAIRAELKRTPTMPATVIAERVGWTRGMTVFTERVRELRPAYLPPDPAGRTSYDAGDVAQCDLWFPPVSIPVGYGQFRRPVQLPVLTMVLGYSRWLSALLLPSRRAEDLFAGWWQLIAALGAVPRTLVWDGEGAIGRNRGGRIELTRDCHAFRGVLGTKVIVLKPAEPEHKGIIERAHDHFERSFLPGREFSGPGDFNHQFGRWLQLVNARQRRVLGCAPIDRIGADLAAMLSLPPVGPQVGWRTSARLARDHYVRLDSNDYSVHPGVIGRRIEVTADLDRVRVFCEGKTVADHERVWAHHQTITDAEHREAANMLRRNRISALRPIREPDGQIVVEQRSLGDYDAALGVDLGDGGLVS